MTEIWKTSKRFPSYAISSHGLIKRIRKSHGAILGNIRKPCTNSSGYFQVPLWENGKQYMVYPHHLVAEEFIGDRPHGCDINHKDRNKKNNTLENLEYITHKKNCPRGERVGLSKLNNLNIKKIKYMYAKGLSQQTIADLFSVVQTTISRVLSKNTWSHL